MRSRPVAPDLAALQLVVAALRERPGAPVQLDADFFPDARLRLRLERVDLLPDGTHALTGRVDGDPLGSAVVVFKGHTVSANVFAHFRSFQLRAQGRGAHEAREIDFAQFELESTNAPAPPVPKLAASSVLAATTADDGSTIDVLVLYTAAARIGASPDDGNDSAAIESQVNLAIAETNAAYASSGVTQQLRLVHQAETAYAESGNPNTDLARLEAPADGFMDEAHALRNTHGADLVSLWVENGGGLIGVGRLMTDVNTSFASQAFSVVPRNRATGDYGFGHVLGRNMGLRRDAFTDPGTTPYPFAHGYVDVTRGFRTIMAFADQCFAAEVDCPRIPYFSNPNVVYDGVPAGDASDANSAAALNLTASTVANFRASVASPGTLAFSPASYTVNEFAGSVILSVTRTAGASGAVTVQYATSNGTATAGSDYTPTSGTLSWADGELGTKTFAVAIANDGANEGNETFSANLVNPTGNASVPSPTATVTILESQADSFPRNCAIPAGWVKPGTATAGWVVDPAQSMEGMCSLRSGAIGHSSTAQIEFTGTFQAGNITFSRRVSSELDYDCLRFLVDGVQKAVSGTCTGSGGVGASGEASWAPITVAIPAGTRTIRWSFERDFSDGGGSNAAWIDNVVLPLAASTTSLMASPNPSTSGQAVTFTATVTGGVGAPTGSMLFKADGNAIAGCTSIALASASAACSTNALSAGTHSITAEYSGNGSYNDSLSSPLTQTVSGATPILSAVASRKSHGSAGAFDLVLDATAALNGAVSVEPRTGGSHAIVFTFGSPVSSAGTVVATDVNGTPIGSAASTAVGNSVIASLSAIPDVSRAKVSLSGVNGASATYSASVGFLLGDADGTRVVSTADVDLVKAQSGLGTNAANARYDLNLSGAVTASDILVAKGRNGLGL